ncbi:hypothetical protein BST81_20420 [Leptolyngbya sp. 'hensonii']|uniref:SanA/YdcF family protein n=1 Tax=Leptolyngbya sp. 'hensonii' TaxID=1922337 RepID=UPI00094FCA26|nr:ElyC/SanA/YdcF family protein [Leptolyngbya sp. 'hensonii']OLP16565.1 hypothetical protein BST81_20420 [Leptolyngbya sp. 'hensonii']
MQHPLKKITVLWEDFFWYLRWIVLAIVATGIIFPLLMSAYVYLTTRDRRYLEARTVPSEPVAIVFGAGVYTDGTPTAMLADRLQAAVQLYKSGRVQKLLMTGDNSTIYYNEVIVMQQYAIRLGVPAEDITLDYAGFSTYESCYRARRIFGVSQAVLVTQHFHLARAIYTCDRLGVESIGLGTPDWSTYGQWTIFPYAIREIMATVKALWQVHVTRPKPTFLGPFEGIK